MSRSLQFVAILFIAACPSNAMAGTDVASGLKERFEPLLQDWIQAHGVPGFGIAVTKDGKVVYTECFGVQNVDTGEKMNPRSLFHMASVTKVFVATAIVQLVEQGKIDLDAPVTRYLPYFKIADDRLAKITVGRMLSHISGMPDEEDFDWDQPNDDDDALERYVRRQTGKKLIAAPGEVQRYSNIAFEVLGDVIAKVSGESFEKYVENHILRPLGMNDSTLLKKEADPKLLTSPHVNDAFLHPEVSKVFPHNRMHGPSSNLLSSMHDMGRWAIANLQRGHLGGKRVLESSSYELLWKPHDPKHPHVGLSWMRREQHGYSTVFHGGGDPGYRAYLILVPDQSLGVVVAANFDGAPVWSVARAAVDVALGFEPVPPKKPLEKVLLRIAIEQSVEAATEEYERLKRINAPSYDYGQRPLNQLGHALLRQGKVQEAIRCFQFYAKAFPESSNAYAGLGDAYLKAGVDDLAIKNYERSLELYPQNDDLRKKIRALRRTRDGG